MKESYDRKDKVKEHSIQKGERVRVKLGQPAGSKLRSHFPEPLEVVAVKGNIFTLSLHSRCWPLAHDTFK